MDSLEAARKRALTENAPTLLLLALQYWDRNDDFVNDELTNRHNRSIWMDTKWSWHKGRHPYTQEQIIAKYREINLC